MKRLGQSWNEAVPYSTHFATLTGKVFNIKTSIPILDYIIINDDD